MITDKQITDWAIEIQAIAQAGLAYSDNPFELERCRQLREIAAEMIAGELEKPIEKVKTMFCSETGYQTPKIDTRAAVFRDGKILLVKEADGRWSLPGGWCEANLSIGENAVKETEEEAGMDVKPELLIAVQDWKKHNVRNLPYGVMKAFVLCRPEGEAHFEENAETTGIAWFSEDEIPEDMADEKNTKKQVLLCFDAYRDKTSWQTKFD